MTPIQPIHDAWPPYLRVTSLIRLPVSHGRGIHNIATLFHEQLSVRVCWRSAHVDARIHFGSLVSINGIPKSARLKIEDPVPVDRLVLINKPLASLNLFETIPDGWCTDRIMVKQATHLWESLGRPFRHLINAVLWESGRFYRFVTGPSASSDSLVQPGGNFREAVRSATQAHQLAGGLPDVYNSVVVAAALLIHAGRADDCRRTDDRICLTERGFWVGGQCSILEWMGVARTQVAMPESQYLALLHTLIGARTASADRQSIEATILAVASRIGAALPVHRLA